MPRSSSRPLSLVSPFSLVLALALAAGLPACAETDIPLSADPGFSEAAPLQERLDKTERIPVSEDQWLVPRATYQLDALVMARKDYDGLLFGDELSDLVPVDFALAWGPAARPQVQSLLTVRQSGRWFYWQYPDRARMPLRHSQLVANMANVHIIPADVLVGADLRQVKKGRCYRLWGALVDIASNNPRLARSTSLTRTDSGGGSCEIFRVEGVEEISCPAS